MTLITGKGRHIVWSIEVCCMSFVMVRLVSAKQHAAVTLSLENVGQVTII